MGSRVIMKKILVCFALLTTSVFFVNATMSSTQTSIVSSDSIGKFIGEYIFCTNDQCERAAYNVYVNAYGYNVSVPMANGTHKVFILMRCQHELGYNYYFSKGGVRWYTRL